MCKPYDSPILINTVCACAAGNWTQALRRVVESVYSFFSYDVKTYIAGNLEIEEGEEEEGTKQETKQENLYRGGHEKKEGEGDGELGGGGEEEKGNCSGRSNDEDGKHNGGGNGGIERCGDRARDSCESSHRSEEGQGDVSNGAQERAEVLEEGADYDDEETDDALSGGDRYDNTSTEEDTFDDTNSPGNGREATSDANSKKNDVVHYRHRHFVSVPASRNHRVRSQSLSNSAQVEDSIRTVDTPSRGATANRTMSSFTVENILMGSTSRSSSTSSGSPTSAHHSSSAAFLPFSHSQGGSRSSSNNAGSTPASPASGNWMSHPPVKYTKFTMMSPSSMRSGGDKRRKSERDKAASAGSQDVNHHHRLSSGVLLVEEGKRGHVVAAAKCKEEPPQSPAPSSVAGCTVMSTLSSAHTHHVPSLTYHHSVIQTAVPTAVPISRQGSGQSITAAAASPRLVPVSPSLMTSFPRAQTSSPHHHQQQQQQYMVFFPPNVALMTAPTSEFQIIGQTSSPQLHAQQSIQHQPTTGKAHTNHSAKHPNLSSSTKSGSSVAVLSTSSPRFTHTIGGHPHAHGSSSDPRYHPIAPRAVKQKPQVEAPKIGAKPLSSSGDKTETKPKQKKLRFHMTTVVKKARRQSSSVSMTAPPPSLCNRTPQSTKQCEPELSATKSESGCVDVDNPKETGGAIVTANAIVEKNHTNTEPAAHTASNSSNAPSLSESPTSGPPPHSSITQPISTTCSPPSNSTSELPDADRHSNLERLEEQCIVPSSLPPTSTETSLALSPPAQGAVGRGKGRGGRGRRTRGYTRRKRELTFHLYEDPYRAKRSRQQN